MMRLIVATALLSLMLAGCNLGSDEALTAPDDSVNTDPGSGNDSEADTGSDTGNDEDGDDSANGSDEPSNPTQFVLVDTNQSQCYDGNGSSISCGSAYPGQDAEYFSNAPSYTNNGDGTITDNHTGLIWAEVTLHDVSFYDAETTASSSTLAGYSDWRIPTIKELYSLIDFSGATGTSSHDDSEVPDDASPFINTLYFDMDYASTGSRFIDAQYITSTVYVDQIFDDNNDATAGEEGFFGVNFADGRIKGYPTIDPPGTTGWNLRLVRGAQSFENDFADNNDGTISDQATGLMWLQDDSGSYSAEVGSRGDGSVDWLEALEWCESLSSAGYDDLQSIVDYTRSPDTTDSAAINPLFEVSSFLDPDGVTINYPYYWSSTTHVESDATKAVYIAFGEAQGRYNVATQESGDSEPLLDVHGAGAQRSDPKITNGDSYPDVHGPQGDIRYVYNFARCVRGGVDTSDDSNTGDDVDTGDDADTGDEAEIETETATFLDIAITGLSFSTDTQSGLMQDGSYEYVAGETVVVSLFGIELYEFETEQIVSAAGFNATFPNTEEEFLEAFFSEGEFEDFQKLTNLIQLLANLDNDADPENGFDVSQFSSVSSVETSIDLSLSPNDFYEQTLIELANELATTRAVTPMVSVAYLYELEEQDMLTYTQATTDSDKDGTLEFQTYHYTAEGYKELVPTQDESGNVTEEIVFEYDEMGRVLLRAYPDYDSSGSKTFDRGYVYEYNDLGQVTSFLSYYDYNGDDGYDSQTIERYQYDSKGWLQIETLEYSNGSSNASTYSYNGDGSVATVYEEGYNNEGLLDSIELYTYSYNDSGLVTEKRNDSDSDADGSYESYRLTTRTYNENNDILVLSNQNYTSEGSFEGGGHPNK